MKSRALRYALLTVCVGSLAGATYLVWKEETKGRAATASLRAFDDRLRHVSRTLLEIKGAQPGYVAAGQGEDFWAARVDALRATVREGMAALRPLAATPQAQAEIDAAAAAIEDFEQMDRRARDYARSGQRLLASDLVFSDGIEKLDEALLALDRARDSERLSTDAAAWMHRRAQVLALAGAAAGTLLILFALAPPPHADPANVPPPRAVHETADLPLIAPAAPARIAVPPPPAAPPPPPEPAPAVAAAAQAAPSIDLGGIASLCTELARVLDTRELPAALERAAKLLDASGIIIWISDPDGRELAAVMAHGYPANLLSRLGTIPRDDTNATAAAYRTGVVQTVKGDGSSPGAIVAPLVAPSGPVGAMAAELLHDGERKEAVRAAAVIVAAQLATLMGPPTRAQGKAEAAGA